MRQVHLRLRRLIRGEDLIAGVMDRDPRGLTMDAANGGILAAAFPRTERFLAERLIGGQGRASWEFPQSTDPSFW
jgi:hypothetical protein